MTDTKNWTVTIPYDEAKALQESGENPDEKLADAYIEGVKAVAVTQSPGLNGPSFPKYLSREQRDMVQGLIVTRQGYRV